MKRIETKDWSVIKSLIPPTAELVVMPKPHDQPAVIVSDLDGDNHQEIACVYRNQGEMYVMIAKQDENRWHPIGNCKGQGYNSLLIGWQIGGVWSNIDILQWSANGFMHMLPQETRASIAVSQSVSFSGGFASLEERVGCNKQKKLKKHPLAGAFTLYEGESLFPYCTL
ncbi:hypothetical protein [Brevibacillus formosus]|uniref:hypothetical protein n=1 Tax=Brevibacillus formosus TaxID=54913 RepID=UPI003F1C04AD